MGLQQPEARECGYKGYGMSPACHGDPLNGLSLRTVGSWRDLACHLGLLLGPTDGLEAADVRSVDLRQDTDNQRCFVYAGVVQDGSSDHTSEQPTLRLQTGLWALRIYRWLALRR